MGLERFNKTVNILVKAYLNDRFIAGDFCGCAVGNLVEASCGYTRVLSSISCSGKRIYKWEEVDFSKGQHWANVFMTTGRGHQDYNPYKYTGIPKHQIDSTGYSVVELARVEKAFETAHYDTWEELGCPEAKWEVDTFSALMAVVDVLAEIDSVDLTAKEEAKLLFVKP